MSKFQTSPHVSLPFVKFIRAHIVNLLKQDMLLHALALIDNVIFKL